MESVSEDALLMQARKRGENERTRERAKKCFEGKRKKDF